MSDYSKNYFKFNLIPPRSSEEIMMYKERDNTVLYSVLLIFFSVFIFFALNLLQFIFINPRINTLENSIKKQESNINTFRAIKISNGELYIKSEALTPVLLKDIGIDRFLGITNQFTQGNNITINNYGRENSGLFVVTFFAEDYKATSDFISLMKQSDDLENVFVRQSIFDETESMIRTTVAFNILEENLGDV